MLNDNPRDDFAILFLTHGRADSICTVDTVKRCGYTGKYYIVIDDEDEQENLYREKFGDKVIKFCKKEIDSWTDRGDNRYWDKRAILWARNASFVKISIDEGDRETYAYCRGVDKLQDVLLNVEKYCKTQSRIGVQCVARNTEQIRRFYATVKRLPVNYIQFRPIELAHHLEHTDTAAMLDLLEKMKLSDQRIYISYKFSHLDRPKACPAHWAAICVKVNGDVPVCCQRSEEIIGNIMDGDIQKKYADYLVGNFQKCEHPCRLTGANMAISRFDTSEISFI